MVMEKSQKKCRVAILGASGYTGAELIRLVYHHPHIELVRLTGDRSAGKPIAAIFPQFNRLDLPTLTALPEPHAIVAPEPQAIVTNDWRDIDLVFCALPHGTTQEVVAALPPHLKIIDLSADFRLRDAGLYEKWYGQAHRALSLQQDAVYGLSELARDQITKARLVANPGCYPTAAQLPLIPLLRAGLIARDSIIIDAKSGVSGAGRAAKEASLFCEVDSGILAYGIASHRHAPEIEQGLSVAAGAEVTVSFTPHLVPMKRGILATIYLQCARGVTADQLRETLAVQYQNEPFVQVLAKGLAPSTQQVFASNNCAIGVFADRVEGRAIIVSAIDNLVKGASGQAVQNMNLMMGWSETLGLNAIAVFP